MENTKKVQLQKCYIDKDKCRGLEADWPSKNYPEAKVVIYTQNIEDRYSS